MAGGQAVLIRVILDRWGERLTTAATLCFTTCAVLIISVLTSGTLALVLTPLTALGAVVLLALREILSRRCLTTPRVHCSAC